MNDDRPTTPTRARTIAGRRWLGLAAVAVATAGLVVGGAVPSQAASKAATTISLASLAPSTGSVVIAGSDTVLKGTASKNLIGKKLTVQEGSAGAWTALAGSGTVSSKKTYTIHVHPVGAGGWQFRVVYAGSAKLKSAASAPRITVVWAWEPMTQMPYVETIGSASNNASPALRTNLVVNGRTYPKVIAGVEQGSQTGASEFTLGGGCIALTTKVGLVDGAPAGTTATFTVSSDKTVKAQTTVTPGHPDTISLGISGVDVLALQNSTTAPVSSTVKTAWPDAELLCDVKIAR